MDRRTTAIVGRTMAGLLLVPLLACSSNVVTTAEPIDADATAAPAGTVRPTPADDPTPTAAPIAPTATTPTPAPAATEPAVEPTVPAPDIELIPVGLAWSGCAPSELAIPSVYRVTNIPADDPDGGLVAHVSPGIDTEVTEVLADGTDELQISGCQRNSNSGNIWWLVSGVGWVNASYLETHVPGGSTDWEPGLSDPIDTAQFGAAVGLLAPDLDSLTPLISDALRVEDFMSFELVDFVGLDAQGAIATYDLVGLRDDSLAGYRLDFSIGVVKHETTGDTIGLRVTSVQARAICMRGVSNGGLCV